MSIPPRSWDAWDACTLEKPETFETMETMEMSVRQGVSPSRSGPPSFKDKDAEWWSVSDDDRETIAEKIGSGRPVKQMR